MDDDINLEEKKNLIKSMMPEVDATEAIMGRISPEERHLYKQNCHMMIELNTEQVHETEKALQEALHEAAELDRQGEGSSAKAIFARRRMHSLQDRLEGWMKWVERWKTWLEEAENWPTRLDEDGS